MKIVRGIILAFLISNIFSLQTHAMFRHVAQVAQKSALESQLNSLNQQLDQANANLAIARRTNDIESIKKYETQIDRLKEKKSQIENQLARMRTAEEAQ